MLASSPALDASGSLLSVAAARLRNFARSSSFARLKLTAAWPISAVSCSGSLGSQSTHRTVHPRLDTQDNSQHSSTTHRHRLCLFGNWLDAVLGERRGPKSDGSCRTRRPPPSRAWVKQPPTRYPMNGRMTRSAQNSNIVKLLVPDVLVCAMVHLQIGQ